VTPLRVLVITPDFPPRPGGIQEVAHKLVSHLVNTTTQVVTLDAPGSQTWDAAHCPRVQRVSTGRDHRAAILRLNAAALASAARFRPDIVLAMHIVTGPSAAAIRRTQGIPVVSYVHAKEVAARPRLARFTLRNSDRIVAVSRYTGALVERTRADMGRVTVIPPGVDWRELPQTDRLTTPSIVTVARLEDEYKGHDVMVRALRLVRAKVPAARWVVVGDGSRRRQIQHMAAAYAVADAIELTGRVSDETRDQWLDRAHVFAMPSRLPANGDAGEGFGIVYLEAGVHGLPVVAGRVGGALDAVVDGATGLLVDPTDHVQVADAISNLLLDRARATRMGAAGSERARAYAWPAIAGRVQRLMAEALSGR
jgi:phosphatidyl-myo-inositol dimannoside synthase